MSVATNDHDVAESLPLSDQNGNIKAKDLSPDVESNIKSHNSAPEKVEKSAASQLHWKVWVIFSGLAVSALLSALEGSVISTALPTIAADLHLGGNYVWVVNIYFLTR